MVDDSRVAQVSLSRMLKEHGLVVDTAESGSEALAYLRLNLHPSVIFLDHMMPGMDGFETLRALKSDPRTSAVPVIMYTSTEGESYMGQALAAGAVDVLRKPIDPAELMRILHRLKTGSEQDANQRVTSTPTHTARDEAARPHVFSLNDGETRSPRTLSGRAQYDMPQSAASQRKTDSGPMAYIADTARSDEEQDSTTPALVWVKRALYLVVLLGPTLWYLQQYRQAEQKRVDAQKEITRLKSEVQPAATSIDQAAQLRDTLATQQRMLRTRTRALTSAVAWALNLQGQYEYDQLPLGDERLLLLRELVARLNAAEFQGVVRVETYVGEFCLVRDEQGAYRLPPRNLPFSRCEVVSHSPEYAGLLGRRQSTEFARFLAEPSPNIQIEIVSRGNSRPLASYPDRSIVQTAGEWNQIARLNNRTDISVIPAP